MMPPARAHRRADALYTIWNQAEINQLVTNKGKGFDKAPQAGSLCKMFSGVVLRACGWKGTSIQENASRPPASGVLRGCAAR